MTAEPLQTGMPIPPDILLQCHNVVMHERQWFSDLHLAHALRIGPALSAALRQVGPAAPVQAPAPALEPQPAEPAPAATVAVPSRTEAPDMPFDLRRSPGLR